VNLNLKLSKALVAAFVFLEFSDDVVVDPDAAVAAMERMVAELQELDPDEQEELLALFSSVSEDYSAKYTDFVLSLATS